MTSDLRALDIGWADDAAALLDDGLAGRWATEDRREQLANAATGMREAEAACVHRLTKDKI